MKLDKKTYELTGKVVGGENAGNLDKEINVPNLEQFDASTTPNSSFNIFLGKRRSGKSVLAEYFVNQMKDNGMLDFIYLLSDTGAGFDSIDAKNKFSDVQLLFNLLENMKKSNQLNKVVNKKDQIKMKEWLLLMILQLN